MINIDYIKYMEFSITCTQELFLDGVMFYYFFFSFTET